MTVLTDRPIDPARLTERVVAASRGGIVTFVGTVRDHHRGRTVTGLAYSCYPAMVEAEAGRLLAEAAELFDATVAVEHRVGELAVGDIAVVVAAAAGHRDAAFAAARWVIDEVKRRLPIWKHERYADGTSEWVHPADPAHAIP